MNPHAAQPAIAGSLQAQRSTKACCRYTWRNVGRRSRSRQPPGAAPGGPGHPGARGPGRRAALAAIAIGAREHALAVLDDFAGDRGGGDGERRGEVELAEVRSRMESIP